MARLAFPAVIVAFGQLVLPFFALLSSRLRADRRWLLAWCGCTLALRFVEAALLILPALPDSRL